MSHGLSPSKLATNLSCASEGSLEACYTFTQSNMAGKSPELKLLTEKIGDSIQQSNQNLRVRITRSFVVAAYDQQTAVGIIHQVLCSGKPALMTKTQGLIHSNHSCQSDQSVGRVNFPKCLKEAQNLGTCWTPAISPGNHVWAMPHHDTGNPWKSCWPSMALQLFRSDFPHCFRSLPRHWNEQKQDDPGIRQPEDDAHGLPGNDPEKKSGNIRLSRRLKFFWGENHWGNPPWDNLYIYIYMYICICVCVIVHLFLYVDRTKISRTSWTPFCTALPCAPGKRAVPSRSGNQGDLLWRFLARRNLTWVDTAGFLFLPGFYHDFSTNWAPNLMAKLGTQDLMHQVFCSPGQLFLGSMYIYIFHVQTHPNIISRWLIKLKWNISFDYNLW